MKELEYMYYRNKKVPRWWEFYLPNEENPYKETDTLTLEKGCLMDYWHIHSSNKHPNYRGAEACNFVRNMIYNRFGGAFLTSRGYANGGRKGEKFYHEPEHIVYHNAYIGDDNKIHINNARQYYEDVILFIQRVLREISRNRYQPADTSNTSDFFPFLTDAQIKKNKIKNQQRQIRTDEVRRQLKEYIFSEEFCISEIELETTEFRASYNYEDGWFNQCFVFKISKTNIGESLGEICIKGYIPYLTYANREKKNRSKATKILEIPYCIFLKKIDDNIDTIVIKIPRDKVGEKVIETINNSCNKAMEIYNIKNTNIVENINVIPTSYYYPYNFFLDNKIGKLNMIYSDEIIYDWRCIW